VTTALYARYSSDLQSERSIDDQVQACKLYAERAAIAGPFIVYADAALSGASMATRPQLQALLADVRGRRVNAVLAESIDRLSRDQADVHLIRRACAANQVRLYTIADGEVTSMVAGLKGIIAEHFLADLAQKVRRGQMGVARSGRIAGGRCYGYRAVEGQPGERVIAPEQALIIGRIFESYASGISPIAIAKALNAEGVIAPRGGVWRGSTLTGDPQIGDGILAQELYRGRLVFNRRRFVKNAETGRRSSLVNPRSEWLIVEAPQLRIIEEKLWLRVAARRAELARAPSIRAQRRPKHLLSGLIRCGSCGAVMGIYAKSRIRCGAAHATGLCDQRASVPMGLIETRVLAGLKRHLLAPDMIGEAVRAYHEERAVLARQEGRRREEIARALAEARRRADRLAETLIDGAGGPTLKAKLAETEAQIAALEAEAAALPDDSVVAFHPAAADFYRASVAKLEEALAGSADLAGLVRPLIASVEASPDAAEPGGWAVTIHGQLAAILALGAETPANLAAGGRSVLVGAGVGFEPTTFRL
jgi:site-specific DNA recombinase